VDRPLAVVSIIIPIFNEAATIVEILEKVHAQKIDGFVFERILIDDGSTDGTLTIFYSKMRILNTIRLILQSY
jgi:glycosyltransferase involved in cell wall biosynthesis